jgi:signal transduction histidine kinase
MTYKNEKSLINIIKFTPPIFILTISLIMTFFLYLDKQRELQKEKNTIKEEFIKKNKDIVSLDVDDLYNFIIKTQESTENRLKENIKNRVYEAKDIAMNIYNENKDSKSKNEIKKMIQDALGNIRFNEGRGYFFIYSLDYECILLPIAKNLEGTSFYNFKDSNGTFLTREIVKQVKTEKEGFLTWYYPKPNDPTKGYKKIGFNTYFEPYDWFIGTGEYFEDFDNDVKKEVLEYISRLRANDSNYFFILDYNKKILFHLIEKNINKNIQDTTNFNNTQVFNDMLFMAKHGSGFITYNHKLLNEFRIKTSYIIGLNNWGWILGKGFYHEDINQIIKKKTNELNTNFHEKVINIIYFALILTIVLLLISFYISKLIEKKFSKYKSEINLYIDKNTKQQHILSQQSKMAAMGEMLGNIAHQWRQPLSVITTLASGMKLQKEFDCLDDETFNKSIENINHSALYLSDTIDDFRNFFKTDKTEIKFDIKDVFEKVLKLTEAQYKNNNILFINNINDYELFGFENEFIQALINILNNAKDALETVNSEKLIFISTYKENNKVFIKITDNAGGIDESIIDKVCEPYFTTKHQSKGTGIGLYMTEEIIVKHMKGNLLIKNVDLTYQNNNYKGTEITIEFDISQQKH